MLQRGLQNMLNSGKNGPKGREGGKRMKMTAGERRGKKSVEQEAGGSVWLRRAWKERLHTLTARETEERAET